MTVYSEQPEPGTRTSYGPKSEWGHSFVTLSVTPLISQDQGDPVEGDPINITFGFYPSENMYGQPFATVPNEILDNSNHKYHIAVEFEINQTQFNSAMETAVTKAENESYDIETYNCTDFAIDIANSLNNVSIPYTNSNYTFLGMKMGEGRNPGDLGEDLKNLSIGNLINVTQSPQGGIYSTCP